MPLLVANLTGSPVALAVGSVTLAASSNPPNPGVWRDVTSEMRPNTTVDATRGISGGLSGANYTSLQGQVDAGTVEFRWSGNVEYLTTGLTPSTAAAPIRPANVATVDAAGLGSMLVLRKAFTALVTGTADDVTIYNANAPFAFRIVDTHVHVSAAIGGSTLTLRSATAGGGSALSDALSSASTGVVRNATLTATPTVAAGGSLILRRSDRAVAGEVIILIQRT